MTRFCSSFRYLVCAPLINHVRQSVLESVDWNQDRAVDTLLIMSDPEYKPEPTLPQRPQRRHTAPVLVCVYTFISLSIQSHTSSRHKNSWTNNSLDNLSCKTNSNGLRAECKVLQDPILVNPERPRSNTRSNRSPKDNRVSPNSRTSSISSQKVCICCPSSLPTC